MIEFICEDINTQGLSAAFEGEYAADCTLSAEIVTVGEEEIKELNASARGVDSVTDVLSFPTLDGIRGKKLRKKDYPTDLDEEGRLFLGSIAICSVRAAEQAREYGHSYNRELYYLIVHGMFHLLGYDHLTVDDKAQMREREERVMSRLNLPREDV